MKRIIIALFAIILSSSLFAIDPKSTEVLLSLALEPDYLMGVTTTAPASGDTALTNVVNTIEMTYDQDTFELEDTDGTHLVSYIFTEYKACTLSAALDGNLILDGKTSTDAADDEQVAFEADITVNGSAVNLKSSAMNSETLVTVTQDATNKDQRIFGSFKLVLKGSTASGDTGVRNKKIGAYSAHLVLTVAETA